MLPKTHFVRPENPTDENGGKSVKGHESRIDGPFALDDACIENDEARNTLETDEGASSELPGIIAMIEPASVCSGHSE